MPRCIPESLDSAAPASEHKVFEKLREALPDSWYLLPGLRNIRPATESHDFAERESDFVIYAPGWGFLVLEVKGGGVYRDESGWFSRDRTGNHNRIKSPGQQAQSNAHGIAQYLRNHPQYRQAQVPRFGWGIALPDSEASGVLSPDLPRALILDRGDLEADDLAARVRELMKAAGLRNEQPALREAANFLKAVAPNLDLTPSLAASIRSDEPVLVRLTKEQAQMLEVMDGNNRVGVRGGAGTGKTMVALERARRQAAKDRRVLFLCFNRPLAEHLRQVAPEIEVATFHELSQRMAESAGLEWKVPLESDEAPRFWAETTAELMLDAAGLLPEQRYDDIIVDEGQDFRELWWTAIDELLRDRASSTLWVFYDPKQDLYGGDPVEGLDLVKGNLTYNCRNTKAIASHVSDLVDGAGKPAPFAPDGVPVETIDCVDESAMQQDLSRTLQRLRHGEKLAAAQIIVLSPFAPAKSRIFQKRQYGNMKLVELGDELDHSSIRFSSLHRFKGLEADVVILVEISEGKPYCSNTHLYVGASRAKHGLIILRYSRATE